MPKIKEITSYLESIAPRSLQESYDNSGLITGDPEEEVTAVLVSLDCTEEVIEEAIKRSCNMVVAHHPILFRALKQLTGKNYVERTLIKAIRNGIAIYAIHTNLDHVSTGVNKRLCELLEIKNPTILQPKKDSLSKLVTFVPKDNTSQVLKAIHEAGAGQIGNYQNCSFRLEGTGSFQPNEHASPAIGEAHKLEEVNEDRIEVLIPNHLTGAVLKALNQAHPYEEVAYYLTALENINQEAGAGMIGNLDQALSPEEFLNLLKSKLDLQVIRYSGNDIKPIKKVAVCGGAGFFLLNQAVYSGADAFITSDIKYHEFFDAENRILLADVGHHESEVHTKGLLYDLLSENFTNFAIHLTEEDTNPIHYFI